jgi:hypothetical protein
VVGFAFPIPFVASISSTLGAKNVQPDGGPLLATLAAHTAKCRLLQKQVLL